MAGTNISVNPKNQNLAQASKFLLSFDRLPDMTFFCKTANIPGISLPSLIQTTPFIDAPIPGDKIVYDKFDIEFLLDEDLFSWTSIHDWLIGLGKPENFDQYKNLSLQQKLQISKIGNKPQYSDAILTAYTNKNNPVLQIKFVDLFPISLSSIQFDTGVSAETILTGRATFSFTNYDILRF